MRKLNNAYTGLRNTYAPHSGTTSRLIGIPFYIIIWIYSIVDAWNPSAKIE